MRDLLFYNAALNGRGLKGRLTTAVQRALRRLLLPFFVQQVRLLDDLHVRIDEGEKNTRGLDARTTQLNTKLDQLNEKLEALLLKFNAQQRRQDELHNEVASVIALNWDHTAIVRRLSQLEDRLIGLGVGSLSTSDEAESELGPSIRFPGLEHVEIRRLDAEPSGEQDAPYRNRTRSDIG